MATDTKKNMHPIVFLDYIPRVLGSLFSASIIISILILEKHTSGWIPYILIFLQAVVWPNVTLFFSLRSKDPKALELNFLMLDNFYFGAWSAYLNFAFWPTALFISCMTMANLSIDGVRFAFRGLFAIAAGALTVVLIHGFEFQPNINFTSSIICIFGFLLFPGLMGYMTNFRAKTAKLTKKKIEMANLELEHINKVVREASMDLELNKITHCTISCINTNTHLQISTYAFIFPF